MPNFKSRRLLVFAFPLLCSAQALISSGAVTTPAIAVTTTPNDNTGAITNVVGCINTGGIDIADGAVTDFSGNTYPGLTQQSVGNLRVRLFYKLNPTTNAGETFTCTLGGSNTAVIFYETFSGVTTFDQETGAAMTNPGGGGSTTFQGGAILPAVNNSIVVSFIGTANGGFGAPLSTVAGFIVTDVANAVGGLAYQIQTTPVSVNPAWDSINDAQAWGIANADFKPGSSPPPPASGNQIRIGVTQ